MDSGYSPGDPIRGGWGLGEERRRRENRGEKKIEKSLGRELRPHKGSSFEHEPEKTNSFPEGFWKSWEEKRGRRRNGRGFGRNGA